jgi:cation:H+ antiporter
MEWLYLLGGLALLAMGGDLLVRGAVRLAERMGVSPLLIGLTLVGFGTSTPELVASLKASLAGSPGIAVGNIVGSNIANILVILGLAALIAPVTVSSRALGRDGVLVLGTAVLFALLGVAGGLGRVAGLVFLLGLAAYIAYAWRQEGAAAAGAGDGHTAAFDRAEAFDAAHLALHKPSPPWVSLGLALAGLVLVVVGGGLLVDGAIGVARGLGISETVIGLTIVAVGTSTPELVTSLVAALRRQSDVALGNVLGSNIYNILGIGGIVGLVAPTPIPAEIARFDSLVMVAVSLLCLVLARTGMRIGRREGGMLLAGYGVYVWMIWPA